MKQNIENTAAQQVTKFMTAQHVMSITPGQVMNITLARSALSTAPLLSGSLRTFFAAFLCLFVIHTCRAQVLTLDEVLNNISQNNASLKTYEIRAQAFDAYAAGAKAWMAPMAGVGTFMTPYRRTNDMMESGKGAIMFTIEQDIPNASRLRATAAYMRTQSGIERTARDRQVNELRAAARITYYTWLVAEKKRQALHENTATLTLMRDLATVRLPYNQGSSGDIHRLNGKISEARNMTAEVDGTIDEAKATLLALMNSARDTEMEIDTTTEVRIAAPIADTTGLHQRRSDLRELDERIRAMELNHTVQLARAKPDFRIRLDHMQPLGNMPAQFSAMAMISIPIAPWSARGYKAESRGIQYDIQALKQERTAILVAATGKLAGMSKQLQAMERQLSGYRQQIIPALQRNFRVALLAYEENRGQLSPALDGWEALNMIGIEYYEKMETYYNLIANYEKELEQ